LIPTAEYFGTRNFLNKLSKATPVQPRRKEKAPTFTPPKTFPSLLLIFMGSMDCATTAIGILYFGAVELNPFLSGIVSTNIFAFIVLKLTTTVFVGLIFRQAEKTLMQTRDKTSRTFKWTKMLLRTACVGVTGFLLVVVANNIIVLAEAM
jgi:hypothetical protein